jgi:hypothetical protein
MKEVLLSEDWGDDEDSKKRVEWINNNIVPRLSNNMEKLAAIKLWEMAQVELNQ